MDPPLALSTAELLHEINRLEAQRTESRRLHMLREELAERPGQDVVMAERLLESWISTR